MKISDNGQATPKASPSLEIRGQSIREDSQGFVNLNDIHELAGGTNGRDPRRWKSLTETKRLFSALSARLQNVGFRDIKRNNKTISVAYTKRGKSGGTFAHPILAAAYAGYLSPELEIEVREIWLRYRSGDATLADDILKRASAEANRWAGVRAQSRGQRSSYASTLAKHGVTGRGFAECTNAIYLQLLGDGAKGIREKRGLPEKANIRESMSVRELSLTMAAEALAEERIDYEKSWGNEECATASALSARAIRGAVDRERATWRKPSTSTGV